MKSKKGFTLIELLAIIVILAIIAVITVPIILNIIEDSQKGAAKDSAYGFKDSLNKFYVSELAKDPHFHLEDGTYTVSEVNGNAVLTGEETYTISLSGTVPTSGTIVIENNDIVGGNVQIGDYCIDLSNMEVTKGECGDTTIADATPERCFDYEPRREIIVKDVEACVTALMSADYYDYEDSEEDAIAVCNVETLYGGTEDLDYEIKFIQMSEDIDLVTSYPNAFEVNNLDEIEITGYICGGQVTEYDDEEGVIVSHTNGEYMDVVIPNKIDGKDVTSIGMEVFSPFDLTTNEMSTEKKVIINSITIPNSVKSIGRSAFDSNQLTSVVIPNSVTNIDDDAFSWNQLTSVTLGNSVTTIGEWAFSNNQLTNVIIPNSVINIDYWAFENNKLTSVTFGNSVTNIGNNAFYGNQLTNVIIPNSVINIGDNAFSWNQLTGVTIPDSVTSIGDNAFSNNQLTSITIPNGVTSIGKYAFSDNQLTSVTLGNSVIEIGSGAFAFSFISNPNLLDSLSDEVIQNILNINNEAFKPYN